MPFGEKLFAASRTNLESLPELPGVFTLYQDGKMIFIGYADGAKHTIKSQLIDHKEGREGPSTQRFDHYTRELTPNVVLRYRDLMVHYARKYHRWPRGNAEACLVLDDISFEAIEPASSGSIAA